MTLLQDLGAPGMEEWISADLNRLREVSERSWKKGADAVAGNRVLAKYRSGSASVRRSMFCRRQTWPGCTLRTSNGVHKARLVAAVQIAGDAAVSSDRTF